VAAYLDFEACCGSRRLVWFDLVWCGLVGFGDPPDPFVLVDAYDFCKQGALCNQESVGAAPQARPIRATDRPSDTTPGRQRRGAVVGAEAGLAGRMFQFWCHIPV